MDYKYFLMVSYFPIDIRKPTLTPYGRKTFVLFDCFDGATKITCKNILNILIRSDILISY